MDIVLEDQISKIERIIGRRTWYVEMIDRESMFQITSTLSSMEAHLLSRIIPHEDTLISICTGAIRINAIIVRTDDSECDLTLNILHPSNVDSMREIACNLVDLIGDRFNREWLDNYASLYTERGQQ